MFKIKEIRFIDPMQYMGKSILIQLKGNATPFLFKVMGITDLNQDNTRLNGYDTENTNLSISLNDIDYVIGG